MWNSQKIREILKDLKFENDFSAITPKQAQHRRERIGTLDFITSAFPETLSIDNKTSYRLRRIFLKQVSDTGLGIQ
jgi:hypothetical protein